MTGALNRYRQLTLMARASAGYSAGRIFALSEIKRRSFATSL